MRGSVLKVIARLLFRSARPGRRISGGGLGRREPLGPHDRHVTETFDCVALLGRGTIVDRSAGNFGGQVKQDMEFVVEGGNRVGFREHDVGLPERWKKCSTV